MRILLDTQVIVWFADRRMSGKLDLGDATPAGMLAAFAEAGFERIAVEPAHLEALARLPRVQFDRKEHKDPFDHLLVAQSIAEDAAFMSSDSKAALYPLRELIDPRR